MSRLFAELPKESRECPAGMDVIIVPRSVDIGGFEVHRALPFERRRMVGPFIFWDQMGPGEFDAGHGVDVRPHPHIGLATVTYLFTGSLDHRDSLGNDRRILPGAVNLMSAGRGIVHSERTGLDVRRRPSRLFGIQSWLAQPKTMEMSEPGFVHVGAADLPVFENDGVCGRLILGEYEGCVSPLETQWETLYLDVNLKAGAVFGIPKVTEERAVYVVNGGIRIGAKDYAGRRMLVFRSGSEVRLEAVGDTHLLVLGGAAMDGPRYIWWNFVASSVERIRSAAADWRNGRFERVPGDEVEFIPLPDLPFPTE